MRQVVTRFFPDILQHIGTFLGPVGDPELVSMHTIIGVEKELALEGDQLIGEGTVVWTGIDILYQPGISCLGIV